MDPEKVLSLIDKGGTITLSAFIVVAFVKGWIVPRWTYDKLEKMYERLEKITFGTIELGTRAVDAAEKKVP